MEEESITFKELVRKFRDYRRIVQARTKAPASHGAFDASLHGQQQCDALKCVCGLNHKFDTC